MAVLLVNNTDRRIQYIASAGEDDFTYPFEIFEDGDLDVFQQQIKLVLNVDYTVTNAGLTGGGSVILTVGATLNDIIVIVGDIAIDQLIDFSIKANFIGTTVQTQYDKMTMIQQQLATDLDQRGLQYNVFTTVKLNGADNIIPTLAAGQFWQMNSTATGIVAVELEVDPGANTLRSELISNQSGSDGAKIVGYFSPILGGTFVNNTFLRIESKTTGSDGASFVGYFDPSDNTEKTVAEKLNEVHQTTPLKNILIGGDFTLNPFQRGTVFTPIPNQGFPADRFQYFQTGSMVVKSTVRIGGAPSLAEAGIFVNKYLRFEVTTGASLGINDKVHIQQSIEGFNWTRIAQRKFTVSFWVFTNLVGTYAVAARNGANDLSNVHTFTVSSPNTWEKQVITFEASPEPGTWDYENGTGLHLSITLAAGTSLQTSTLNSWESGDFIAGTAQTNWAATAANFFDIALVQAEEGDVETQFEIRTIGEELALCQRYFFKTYPQGINPGTVNNDGPATTSVADSILTHFSQFLTVDMPVTLRKVPTSAELVSFSTKESTPNKLFDVTSGNSLNAVSANTGTNIVSVKPASGGIPPLSNLEAHITVDVEL